MIDKKRALEVIEFIQLLHLTGDFYGQPFVLQDWQHEVLTNVYGTIKENGYRQYQYAYLEIPKKNGKTELTAAVSLYHLVCDGPSGQIYCCAAEREQASLVYRAAKQMIEQDPVLEKILNVVDSKKEIYNRETGTYLKVLSAEAYSKHGVNPTVVIFDELHAQQKRDLWDFMTFGAGSARKEPLWWVITTAGDDPDKHSIGWEVHEKARKVLDGELSDPIWYVKIYGAPETANIYDEKTWYECNPSLGVSIDIEAVRQEALTARNSEAAEKLFRWLRLNQWVSLKRTGWLPITLWDETVCDWTLESLIGKECYIGIDLASNIDITGIVALFPPQADIPNWRFLTTGWIPADNIKERVDRDHAPYDKWLKAKEIKATPGDVVDYSFIKTDLEQMERLYDIKYYCGDPWHLEVLKQHFNSDVADKFIQISQTIAGMAPSMKELDRLFREKDISHPKSAPGRWCFGNVVVAVDGNENMKPMKNKSIEKIDLTVALVNAFAGALKLMDEISVYETRGMRSLA
jgi:phage terminase large subunit-like protein